MAFEYSMDRIAGKVGERARLYNFKVIIGQGFPDISQKLIVSCSTPKLTIEGIPISWTSTSYEINGKGTFDPVTLTIQENMKGEVLKGFYDWNNKCINLENKEFTGEHYEDICKTMEIHQLDAKGDEAFHYIMYDCMPDGMPTITYSYEGSAVVQYDITIKYLSYEVK